MIKNVLITGATGFLGSHLTQRFVDEGHNVIILKKSDFETRRINHLLNKIISYDIDTVDLETPFRENEIEAVIHTATLYGRGNEKYSDLVDVNLVLPLKILERAVSSGTKIFINTDTVLDKNTNGYSLSKTHFSEWLKFLTYEIRIFNLKLEHMYGDWDDFSKFIPFIIKELLLQKKEIKLTKGEQLRDFIYIDDVVEAFYSIIQKGLNFKPGFYVYEYGTGKPQSLQSVVTLIKKLTGNTNTFLNFGALPYRENELFKSTSGFENLKKDFDIQPSVSLEEGLKKTIEWYQNNMGLLNE